MLLCYVLLTVSLKGLLPWPVAAFGVMLYIIFFEMGLGCITFFIATEMIEPQYLGRVQYIDMSLNWFFNLCIGMFFPYMVLNFGPLSFGTFAFDLFLTFFYSILVSPETAGKSRRENSQYVGEFHSD